MHHLLAINPGSTSTKLAYFQDLECVSAKTLRHETEELEKYGSIIDQYSFRRQTIMAYLDEQHIDIGRLDAVVARGGLLKPLAGGTYLVNKPMLDDLKSARYGQHASNLGAVIAWELAAGVNIPAYIVNPVVVDEFEPLARYSGSPEIPRKSAFHALNQKAMAVKAAAELKKRYDETNLIVAHLGGGISVGAHRKGRVIDVNDALEEGPFSPERTGSVPVMRLVDMCFEGKYSKDEIKKKLVGKGGLTAYLGTADAREIEAYINAGNEKARTIYEAMAYQVAKEIGACATVLCGDVDSIVITGGLARSESVVEWIVERVKFIAPVKVYPGEDEMAAMAEGAYKVLNGEERVSVYE